VLKASSLGQLFPPIPREGMCELLSSQRFLQMIPGKSENNVSVK